MLAHKHNTVSREFGTLLHHYNLHFTDTHTEKVAETLTTSNAEENKDIDKRRAQEHGNHHHRTVRCSTDNGVM